MKYTLSMKDYLLRIQSIRWGGGGLIILNKDYFLSVLKFVVEMETFFFLIGHPFRVQRIFICNAK